MPADDHHLPSPVVMGVEHEEEEQVMTVVDEFINSNKEGGKWGPTLMVCFLYIFFILFKFCFTLLIYLCSIFFFLGKGSV